MSFVLLRAATFGWLCVETLSVNPKNPATAQPPSGGCVLKLSKANIVSLNLLAATFGWLCVETVAEKKDQRKQKAATFGWLCVET